MLTKFGRAKIDNSGYYRITSSKEGNNMKLLHRLIFEDFYGRIPDGCHVHHKDKNKVNNCIMNLQLLTEFEHKSLHNKGKVFSDEHKKNLSEAHKGKKHMQETRKKISELKNTTGIMYVTKKKNKRYKQGFYWRYQYTDENSKRKSINSVDLSKLKDKVLANGLPWEEI